MYRNSIIVGPDITQPETDKAAIVDTINQIKKGKKAKHFLKSFLRHLKNPNCLDAVSFHQ